MSLVNISRAAVLVMALSLFSCDGERGKLESQNKQLTVENADFRLQVDSLKLEIERLKCEIRLNRKISEKQSAIVARELQPMDLSWDGK